jgi:hypothetical protein
MTACLVSQGGNVLLVELGRTHCVAELDWQHVSALAVKATSSNGHFRRQTSSCCFTAAEVGTTALRRRIGQRHVAPTLGQQRLALCLGFLHSGCRVGTHAVLLILPNLCVTLCTHVVGDISVGTLLVNAATHLSLAHSWSLAIV